MTSYDRRAACRRAWGRGPVILRFEPLEGRQLLASIGPAPDLLATQFSTVPSADWGNLIHATGTITNQGTATTTAPVEVDIFLSTSPILGAAGSTGSLLGAAVIPAGLPSGGTYSLDQIVALPPSIAGVAPSTRTFYVGLSVDPHQNVPEASTANKVDRGLGLDTSVLTITPHQPANLVGTAINLTPTVESTAGTLSWGDTFNLTEQIQNNGQGDAPPTRARIVLTPSGASPGGYSDVTIGTIPIPAIGAFQSTNVSQQVILPLIEPATLNASTAFTVSIVQDGDFLTQPIYPRIADQGNGHDQGPIGIAPGPLAGTTVPALPDVAVASVVPSTSSLSWGQQFLVNAVIQNVGLGDAGSFRVRFVATGVSGDVSHGIFLGDTMVSGLAAGATTSVVSAVQLPSKLPFGDSIPNPDYARIYAIVDPEDVVNESTRSNNLAGSAPVLLSVLTANGTTPATVPTYAQNIYNVPVLAAQAAKNAGKTAKLGTPKPAASAKPVVKHKVDFLASLSEGITKGIVKQVLALPKNTYKLYKSVAKNISGSATGSTNTTNTGSSTSTTTPTTVNSTTATAGGSGGFSATPAGT